MARRGAPGGQSSIVLGGDGAGGPEALGHVSANTFATGSNQNCGNILTGRPTTGVKYAPGGVSTICLGDDPAPLPPASSRASAEPQPGAARPARLEPGPVSANAFAMGSNQNCGNFLTDRPTTGVRCAPGGNSTLSLGSDPDGGVAVRSCRQVSSQAVPVASPACRPPPGGASTFVLG